MADGMWDTETKACVSVLNQPIPVRCYIPASFQRCIIFLLLFIVAELLIRMAPAQCQSCGCPAEAAHREAVNPQ